MALAIAGCAALLIAAVDLFSPNRAPRRSAARPATEAAPADPEPRSSEESVDRASKSLLLRAVAPEGTAYEAIPIAIADEREVLDVLDVVPNADPVEWGPVDQPVVVGVQFDPAREDAFRHLEALSWPAACYVRPRREDGKSAYEVVLEFRLSPRTAGLRIDVQTVDGSPVPAVLCRMSQRHNGTRAVFELPPVEVRGSAFFNWLPEAQCNLVPEYPDEYELLPGGRRVAPSASREARVLIEFRGKLGSLRGTIVLMAGDEQLRGVGIYRAEEGRFVPFKGFQSDSTGAFGVDKIAPGRYLLVSWPDGYRPITREFEITDGSVTELNVVASKGGASVAGTLCDADGRAQASRWFNFNCVMQAAGARPQGRPFQTGADGTFRIGSVPPGSYYIILWDRKVMRRVEVAATGGEVSLGEVKLPGSLGPGRTVSGTLRLRGRGIPSGWVCLARADAPADAWFRHTHTKSGGQYTFIRVPPGRYALWLEPGAKLNGFAPPQPMSIHVGAEDVVQDLDVPQ